VPRLRDYLQTRPQKGPNDFVFTDPDGSQLRHVGWFYGQFFRPAPKRPGCPRHSGLTTYGTLAALLITDGWYPLAISRRLGHSTITVTMHRYGHLRLSLEAKPHQPYRKDLHRLAHGNRHRQRDPAQMTTD
jgi:integrase